MSMPSCVEIGNFYPRPPRGGRRDVRWSADLSEVFLSTPSARRATAANVPEGGPLGISIHALREEGDQQSLASLDKSVNKFLSTPSARRATAGLGRTPAKLKLFLSTPSARRATYQRLQQPMRTNISIHALREEGDRGLYQALPGGTEISIHALREEGDTMRMYGNI